MLLGLPTKLEPKVIPEPMSGCWIWLGTLDKDGYGKTTHSRDGLKRDVRAHRLVYELLVGPIPHGALLRHSCDNPCCVNPDHLCVGTHQDNVADRVGRGRTSRGDTHVCAKLTSDQVRAIRAATGRLTDIAKQFNITDSHAYLIRSGRTWKHLLQEDSQ